MNNCIRKCPMWPALAAALLLTACGGGGDAPVNDTVQAVAPLSIPPAVSLPIASVAPGSNVTCRNLRLEDVTVDSVTVPSGAVCVLNRTRVAGSVQVGQGSVLDARGVRVQGNVQADGAADVLLVQGASIGGSIQLKQGGRVVVADARIGGDLQVSAYRGPVLVQANHLQGNMQFDDNGGGLTVSLNTVVGNLQCKGNHPLPVGTGNQAAAVEEQCRTLSAPVSPAPIMPLPPGTPVPVLPPAVAVPAEGTFVCRDVTIAAMQVDTVVIPAGARCVLAGTRTMGSVLLQPGSTLFARDVMIAGNLQAEEPAGVSLTGAARVVGSVQVARAGAVMLAQAQVGGDVQINAGAGLVWAQALVVGGNMQINENRGGVLLFDNRIAGNLQCEGNQPAPDGRGNAAEIKQGQCASL